MSRRHFLLAATLALGGCATALDAGSPGVGDGAVTHDSSVSGGDAADVGGGDGTLADAKDSALIFETEGDAPTDDSSVIADGDVGADTKSDAGTDTKIDTGFDAGVDTGIDSGVTRCGATAPKVLFYGPVGTKEQPFVPAGSVVTIAADATWRAMTAAEFGSYNLIVIGEQGSGPGLGGTVWQAAFDTKATWNAAVTGRVVVTTLDPVAHSGLGTTFVRASLSWAATGPGTGLYVGPDYGNRKLDFMSGFGAWTALGQPAPDSSYGDDLHVVLTAHGSMVGSTDASLSSWSYSYHGSVTSFPASFVSVVTSKSIPTRHIVVARDVACPP